MPEIHLRQRTAHNKFGFTYRAWGAFAKSKESIQKFKETWDSWHIFPNKLDKACFKSDMAYGDFKYLIRTRAFDIYFDKAFNVVKNLKYGGYQKGLLSMVYKFFDKKPTPLALSEALRLEIYANFAR